MNLWARFILPLWLLACALPAYAQVTDSNFLTREDVIRLTLSRHPQVEQAARALAEAGARIGASRSYYYPDISTVGGYTRVGPVASFDLPGGGSEKIAPYDNYDIHVELRQTLYDFGKTGTSVRLAEASRQLAGDDVDFVKTNLAYQVLTAFNSILIQQQTLAVIAEQMIALRKHLDVSVRRIQAGTATNYDTLTTQVRIAVARNDSIDAQHVLEAQEISLRHLAGLPSDQSLRLKGEFSTVTAVPNRDSLLTAADRQRPEIAISKDAEQVARTQAELAGFGDKPSLSLNLATGFKNGYIPNLNTPKANFAAGVRLTVPLFNGHRTSFEESAATAHVQAAQARTADVRNQVTSEIDQALAGVRASLEKIAASDIQIRQAQQAVDMANTQYEAGVITNVEVLDAETVLSQTRLIRLRALYDYTVSLTALDEATGKKQW